MRLFLTAAFANYAQQVTGTTSAGKSVNATSSLQELSETKEQTAKEARTGDQVAIRKLKQLQQKQLQANAPAQSNEEVQSGAPESGKGAAVDHKA